MNSFTDVYSGLPINPSEVAYNPLTISSNTTLTWPSVAVEGNYIAAGIMQITATTSGLKLLLPDATQVSPGQSILFVNVGSIAFTVTDNSGNTVQSCSPGTTNYIYLINNTSTNGSWATILFGANSASINAAALAGSGLLAIASTLNQNSPITAVSAGYTLSAGDRANTIRNTGGTVAYSSQSPSALGNGWYTQIKNSGTGTITFTPGSGTIDGQSSLALNPGASAIIASDGSNFYSLFITTTNTISYTRLVMSVAGSSNVTLTSVEAAFSILSFTGTLTGNINILAPASVTEWIVENNTSGSFTATFKTSAGTGIALSPTGGDIAQGTVNPAYCDGTNIRLSVTIPAANLTSIVGGTGIVVGTTSGIAVVSISSTGVSAGTYGDSFDIPRIALNAQGQVTAASSAPIVIPSSTVTNSMLATMPANTIKNNPTGSSANPTDSTLTTILDSDLSSTQGVIPYRGASTWSALSTGTSGQFLQTQGTSSNPIWASSAVLLSQQTVSNATTIEFTSIPQTYNQYEFRLTNLTPTVNGAQLLLQVSNDNGATFNIIDYDMSQVASNLNGTINSGGLTGATAAQLGYSNVAASSSGGVSGTLVMPSLGSPSFNKQGVFSLVVADSANGGAPTHTHGSFLFYGNLSAVNAIQFFFSSGNISGIISVYGTL